MVIRYTPYGSWTAQNTANVGVFTQRSTGSLATDLLQHDQAQADDE